MNILCDGGDGYRDNPKNGCHAVTLTVFEAGLYATAIAIVPNQ